MRKNLFRLRLKTFVIVASPEIKVFLHVYYILVGVSVRPQVELNFLVLKFLARDFFVVLTGAVIETILKSMVRRCSCRTYRLYW